MITEIEFNDAVVWEAVEDAVNDAAKEIVDNCAWDAVESDVRSVAEECGEEAAREYCEYNLEVPDVGDAVESLLREMVSSLKADGPLCGFGTLAKEAIQLVAQPLVAEPFPVVDRERIDGDLDTQRRIADLERQVKALLDAVCTLGERAASVTPNG
jgi:hypothetical protein